MFDFFRNNIKFLMGFLMLLIIPSFVMFGVDNYTRDQSKGEAVGHVGKQAITRQEWDNAHRQAVDDIQARNPNVDRSLLDTAALRRSTLDNMLDQRVLALAAQDSRMITSDQRLARALTSDPNIAALRKADGSLDMERYRDALRAQGMTPESYENSLRADFARRQVVQGLLASSFQSTGTAQSAMRAWGEQREVQLAFIQPKDFRPTAPISDEDLKAFYDRQREQFKTAEQVDVEYVVLDLDSVARGISLSESDLRAYHEQNKAKLAGNEKRRASHILLTVPSGASADAKAKVKSEAEALLADLRKSPQRFAELAKAKSQDPGSAARGGDLDFFSRGAMVKPFEDAAFALQKGQISDVVESEFGYHIIQLTDVQAPKVASFESVRAQLEAELKQQQAQRKFAEASVDFGNLVYEQSDTFAAVASKFGLKVQSFKGLQRSPAPDVPAVLAAPKLLEQVFSDESLRQKRNTTAVEAGKNQLISARVLAHRPAEVQAFEVVKDQVRERVLAQKSTEWAKVEGERKLADWKAKGDAAGLGAARLVSRTATRDVPAPVLAAVFSAKIDPAAPAWVGVDLGAQGYAVARVNKVLERAAPSKEQAQVEREQMNRLWAEAESLAYMASLRKHFKAEVDQKALLSEAK